jgi:hypothetical protein
MRKTSTTAPVYLGLMPPCMSARIVKVIFRRKVTFGSFSYGHPLKTKCLNFSLWPFLVCVLRVLTCKLETRSKQKDL